MRRIVAVFAVFAVLVLSIPTVSAADDAGVLVGARAAYGAPIGNVAGAGAGSLSDVYGWSAPIWLEGGWRFDPHWFAGAWFQYAVAGISNRFKSDASSVLGQSSIAASGFGGHAVLAGVEGTYNFLPDARFAPWIGLGAGYEWASQSFTATMSGINADATSRFDGWTVMLQVGGDYRASPQFTVGPFASMTFGWYQGVHVDVSALGTSQSQSADITEKDMHGWFQFGIRGTFNL